MKYYSIKFSEDDALVLFEYLERFDDTDNLSFVHASEYLALQKLHGQLCKTTSAMLRKDYGELLALARSRIAEGFEGEVPCLSNVNGREDG